MMLRQAILATLALLWLNSAQGQAVRPVHLQTGDLTAASPRLEWTLEPLYAARGVRQVGYEIRVATSAQVLSTGRADLWDSSRVASDAMHATYGGRPLPAGSSLVWQVRTWQTALGHAQPLASAWSAPATFITGIGQWSAQWIAATPDALPGSPLGVGNDLPLPVFRRTVMLPSRPVRAMLFVTGLGQYEFRINGRNITQDVLAPGWTDTRKHILYNAYDVTEMLNAGPNALAVLLGNGMYNALAVKGRYSKFSNSNGQPKLIAELHLNFADGTRQTVVSDASWRTASGPITFSNTYGGEDFDARLEQTGWDQAAFDDTGWQSALVVASPGGALVRDQMPPIRVLEQFEPAGITHPRDGVTVYDLGQNFAGWPELTVSGAAGGSVRLLCGELLDKDGLVTQRSADAHPSAPATFRYTLRGGGERETWHPRFSYYGFRYVQVESSSPTVNVLSLRGEAIHQDDERVGSFTSSDELLNRIHRLILSAVRANLMSILTDCPHREKLGWLEQTHLFAASLMDNYDVEALYRQMGDDMADAQSASGLVPSIAPEVTKFVDRKGNSTDFRDSPEWGSAVVLSPWAAYQAYGDPAPLQAHYGSMQRYVAFLEGKAKDHMLDYGLGDWYDIGPRAPGYSQLTSKRLTATAIFYQDLTTLAEIAAVLDRPQDATTYTEQATAVRDAFNAALFHPETGTYDRNSQTASAMPLALGMVPAKARAVVLRNLVNDIEAHGYHVTAGDIGFHYVVRALTDAGRSDVLARMLEQTTSPSYGYQLSQGATTLTEAWDANPSSSQDHFMLGHAEEWFYRGLAGIDVDLSRPPGQQIRIAPYLSTPNAGATAHAAASIETPLGLVKSSWNRSGANVTFAVSVPPNTLATIELPSGCHHWTESGALLTGSKGIEVITGQSLRVSSGGYRFTGSCR